MSTIDLPDPEFLDWRSVARCTTDTAAQFILEKGQSTKAAKALCAECPVTSACRAYAIRTGQRQGVWGGLGARQLLNMAREQVAS